MENFKRLTNKVANMGWFGGELQLTITIKNSFEGFYGKASEDWESQITIESNEVKEQDNVVFPALKVIGRRWNSIDNVAGTFIKKLKISTNGKLDLNKDV